MLDVTLVSIAFVTALIGLVAGLLIGRFTAPGETRHKDMERQLDEALQQQKAYRSEVVEHFNGTAKLLNKLTDSYREVHTHLAAGAHDLCEGNGPVIPGRLADDQQPNALPDLDDIKPPLDYAPKASPDDHGVLNERFGLDPKKSEPEVAEAPKEPEPQRA